MYYPYTQQEEVTGSWASYTAHESYPPQPPHPPTSLWYAAQTDGPGPSYGGPSHGSSPYPAQYGRPSFSQSDYAPVSSAPGNEEEPAAANGAEGTSTPVNGTAKEKSAGNKKKKRKSEREPSVGSGDAADKDREKRIKTGRACDACRSKKIRCDILSAGESDAEGRPPLCAHCKQYKLECTFFLPITETRFKRKKAAPAVSFADQPEKEVEPAVNYTESPVRPPGEVPGRIEGPTSLSFLLHTSLPASASEAYDLRYHHSWEVSEDGNGLIRVKAPPSSNDGRYGENGENGDPSHTHNKLNRPVINARTISLLVNAYFDHLAHLFPVISRSEFAAKQTPPPLLLYSICGVGSTRREFPREIFAGVRGIINGLLRSNDILSDARIENVQALLVLAQVGDLHAQPTAATASASLMRTGSAIRMAQDLGLHRESHVRAQTPKDLAYVELRRRIWATCVIMDRWYGAALGIPLTVDLLDCDVLLPAGYDIIQDQNPSTWPIEPSFLALTEHLKLSILVGRVLKTIYSPTGLKHATDEQLYSILEDMRAWKEGLPEGLRLEGPKSSFATGLLHLAYTTLHFLLWRPFMRITYICPPHLQFALETMHWSEMAMWATEALDWLNHNPEALDTVFVYSYAATSCALVQYHTWVRRREPGSLESLKQVRETALRWEEAVQPDQMSIRRKTCETMTLLYEAALKTNPEDDRPPAINPTAGVQHRPALGKAIWKRDTLNPYGGIWVAQDNEEKEDSGLTENSVVIMGDVGKERPPPEMESTDPSIRQTHGPPDDPMQVFRDMQMAGSSVNVNPQMNFAGLDFGGDVSGMANGFADVSC
ncbi:fungal-specific transcription factor domain-containing protein [Dioszegia hungarica]|uniref:Fungal-specific transcription factor domain-containing protein n=1 Tax=Dioszegia hungarica TaxID=4972 RepID=A0AA38HB18_9TREE|nr:fungal-specific transcription factor domain-containing protein [Dioszegia hungarica]KAI9637068.1 fungal-specific transcription factor domain-containing protein [Dioszegia hungarica]